jgi:2-polyprenyl-6-methoxyphenol hydroxylase-like FAD-dependent oxidoreductase
MAGLFSALALAGPDRRITLVERDPEPPLGGPDAAFEAWNRRGAPQFRQSHAFLARLLNVIRSRRPALLKDLMDAGIRELRFCDLLPEQMQETYKPGSGDGALSILVSRRATLEWVLRRHVASQPDVAILSATAVEGLLTRRIEGGRLEVFGVRARRTGGDLEERAADLVVDASGRGSFCPRWLADAGAPLPSTDEGSGVVYYTRHYRTRPDAPALASQAGSGAGDLGFLKYGVFHGEAGWFSITLAAPEPEGVLRRAIARPETFDAICASLPGLSAWIDPHRAEPKSEVLAMGDLRSSWRRLLGPDGEPCALNFFMVGDVLIRSNPLYGRGCTFAALEAFALADSLETTAASSRTKAYQARLDTELRPFFDDMVKQDRAAVRRARRVSDPAARQSLRGRITKSLVEDAIGPALRSDVTLIREALSAFHMLAPPKAWLRRPRVILTILRLWVTPRRFKRRFYPRTPGPSRGEVMALISAGADKGLSVRDAPDAAASKAA